MIVIYVGDARDVMKRVRTQHCSGNVEASVLRKHVAQAKGYTFTHTKQARGSTRVRLNLADPRGGERAVSDYLRSDRWKYVICASYEEAHDFQSYAIAHLSPTLNVNRADWDQQHQRRYSELLHALTSSQSFVYSQLSCQPTGPGVYVLYHDQLP